MWAGLTWKDFWQLAILGSFVTVLGNLIAVYLKDVIAARSLERWKTRQALDAVYDRYRRPICMAAEELSGRCYTLAKAPEPWRKLVSLEDTRLASPNNVLGAEAGNPYYVYKILSDAYRLCCFLGWLELYRRDLGLMNVQSRQNGKALEDCIKSIRSDLADGQLNLHPDWIKWRDFLIFREEQRAIAYRMIAQSPSLGLIDYGTFCEMLGSDSAGRWFTSAVQFFVEIGFDQDFRRTRMKLLVVHLTALRELLQPGSVWPPHLKGSKQFKGELEAERQTVKGDLPGRALHKH